MKKSIKNRATVISNPEGDDILSNDSMAMQHQEKPQQQPSSFSISSSSSSSYPSGGTRAIQRNRRGPMSRRYNNSSNTPSTAFRNNQRKNYSGKKGYSRYNLTTHIDHDDREILIESALGGYTYNDDNNYDEDYNTHDQWPSSASSGNGSSGNGNIKSRRRRNYAPLRGHDILSDDERKDFSFPSPESIFALPKSWSWQWPSWPYQQNEDILPNVEQQQQYNYKKLYFRLIMFFVGIGIYSIAFTIMNKYNHRMGTATTSWSLPKETDVDIKEMITQHIFEYNDSNSTNSASESNKNENRSNHHTHENNMILKIKKDETLDIGYYNGEDDDMNLNLSKSGGAKNREKETTTNITTEQGKDLL